MLLGVLVASGALVACSATVQGSAVRLGDAAEAERSDTDHTDPDSSASSVPGATDTGAPSESDAGDGGDAADPTDGTADPGGERPAQPGHSTGPGGGLGTPPSVIDGMALGDADTTWEVDLADDAIVLGHDIAQNGLIEADSEAGRYVFAASALSGVDIAEGDALLVAGVGVGRVESVNQQGDSVVIGTSEASLADVIDNGAMAWDTDISWGADWLVGDQPAADSLRGTSAPAASLPRTLPLSGVAMVDRQGRPHDVVATVAADGIAWEYAEGANQYTFKIQPQGDTMSVAIQVSRSGLTYTATGTVGAAKTAGRADYSDGTLSAATIDAGGMTSKFKLSVAAAGAGNDKDFAFDVPGLMFKYPIMVGPVLVTIGMTAQIVGAITVPASGSATFESDFSYSADGGFSYDGSKIIPTGQLGSFQMNPEAADPAGYIGEHVNVQFGVAFPKLTVTLFGAGPSAFLRPAVFLGTELTWGPVCKTAYVRAELAGGYDFSLLGVSLLKDSTTLWEDRNDAKGDGCE